MNKIKIVLVVLVNLILQSTVFSRFDILSVHANINIPVIIGLGIGFGPFVGGFGGLIIGIIEDVLFAEVLGVRALVYFIIGFLIGNSEVGINKEDVRSGLVLTAIATIGNFIGTSLIMKLVSNEAISFSYLFGPILIEIILNCLLYIVVFKVLKKLFVFPRFRL